MFEDFAGVVWADASPLSFSVHQKNYCISQNVVYQLRNRQQVNIKQHFKLSLIKVCRSSLFLPLFLSVVFDNSLLFRKVWEWPFTAIIGMLKKGEDYEEQKEMWLCVVLVMFKVKVCRRYSKIKNRVLMTSFCVCCTSFYLFLQPMNLDIRQRWVTATNPFSRGCCNSVLKGTNPI